MTMISLWRHSHHNGVIFMIVASFSLWRHFRFDVIFIIMASYLWSWRHFHCGVIFTMTSFSLWRHIHHHGVIFIIVASFSLWRHFHYDAIFIILQLSIKPANLRMILTYSQYHSPSPSLQEREEFAYRVLMLMVQLIVCWMKNSKIQSFVAGPSVSIGPLLYLPGPESVAIN